MFITGKYNTAIVYADSIEETAIEQIKQLCSIESMKDSKIRIMPDTHAGKGCVIGTTMTIQDKIIPNLVGVDIGCGVLAVKFHTEDIDFKKLDDFIHQHIPHGNNVRQTEHFLNNEINFNDLYCLDHIDLERAKHSIGTLGSGNHYIEINTDDENNYYLVVHSGSRYLGLQTANYYQSLGNGEEETPKELYHIEGDIFTQYVHDMKIVQKFAILNRKAMVDDICNYMEWNIEDEIETIHNYLDTEHMILRKGSISSMLDEKCIIPLNMKDGSLICVGKGNPEWNQSAPHGAGRLLSRGDAKRNLTIDEFQEKMEGIYSTCISEKTLDESPMAYKSKDFIINNISDTVDIIKQIKPIYNFKAN